MYKRLRPKPTNTRSDALDQLPPVTVEVRIPAGHWTSLRGTGVRVKFDGSGSGTVRTEYGRIVRLTPPAPWRIEYTQ